MLKWRVFNAKTPRWNVRREHFLTVKCHDNLECQGKKVWLEIITIIIISGKIQRGKARAKIETNYLIQCAAFVGSFMPNEPPPGNHVSLVNCGIVNDDSRLMETYTKPDDDALGVFQIWILQTQSASGSFLCLHSFLYLLKILKSPWIVYFRHSSTAGQFLIPTSALPHKRIFQYKQQIPRHFIADHNGNISRATGYYQFGSVVVQCAHTDQQ